MLRALDPYHRIRATVALLFLVMVAMLAVASLHWPRHSGSGSGSGSISTASSPGAQPTP